MLTCSHFSARVLRSERMRKASRALPQVPQHFDCALANQSLLAPPVALISFTSSGADLRTQEPEQNRSINRDFLNFCLVGPHWSQSITRGFESSAAQSVEDDDRLRFMKYLVERKSQFPCGILFLILAQKQAQI